MLEQNAFHLMYLFVAVMGTMMLPITIGLIAVWRDGSAESAPQTAASSVETVPVAEPSV